MAASNSGIAKQVAKTAAKKAAWSGAKKAVASIAGSSAGASIGAYLSPVLLALLLLLLGFFVLIIGIAVMSSSTQQPQELTMQHWEVSASFPAAAQKYLPIYQEAGQKYGVPWQILAGIHKVETDFGRNLNVSSVGARGHTQFMPKTWVGWSYPGGTRLGNLPDHVDITNPALIAKHGGFGLDANGDGKADPYDPVDAIHSTAKYLASNHRPGEDWFAPKGAVWHYNHDYQNYVLKVKGYAEQFANPTAIATAGSGELLFPVQGGTITSEFGRRYHPIKKVYKDHRGVDIGKGMGAPILASDSGTVVESRPSTGYGWKIVIDHGGVQTLYAHMYDKDVKVKVGQSVQKGDVIALMGSNGWSTGPHLHFEVLQKGTPTNPMSFIKR